MTPVQLTGFFLWRAGLLIVASYSILRGMRLALRHLNLPAQLEIGLGLALAGAVLVLGSIVAERVRDAREEDFTE